MSTWAFDGFHNVYQKSHISCMRRYADSSLKLASLICGMMIRDESCLTRAKQVLCVSFVMCFVNHGRVINKSNILISWSLKVKTTATLTSCVLPPSSPRNIFFMEY